MGVSILIHKTLSFTLLDIRLDPVGQYVIIHALCDSTDMVIFGLYTPPPVTLAVLHKFQVTVAQYPTTNVFPAGDINMPPTAGD